MTATQRKLYLLQDVAEDESNLDLLLDKLLHVLHDQYRERLTHYETALKVFEEQYGMDSARFYQQFEAGNLGDSMDFFEWSGLYELWQTLQEKIHRLESV
jgi:hypothetical protein